MDENNETTGVELQKLLHKESLDVSLSTVLRWRSDLGWTSKSTKYCQMIRDENKEKRLKWARNVDKLDSFVDVVFSDETTVQINSHIKRCCFKRGENQGQTKA